MWQCGSVEVALLTSLAACTTRGPRPERPSVRGPSVRASKVRRAKSNFFFGLRKTILAKSEGRGLRSERPWRDSRLGRDCRALDAARASNARHTRHSAGRGVHRLRDSARPRGLAASPPQRGSSSATQLAAGRRRAGAGPGRGRGPGAGGGRREVGAAKRVSSRAAGCRRRRQGPGAGGRGGAGRAASTAAPRARHCWRCGPPGLRPRARGAFVAAVIPTLYMKSPITRGRPPYPLRGHCEETKGGGLASNGLSSRPGGRRGAWERPCSGASRGSP